MPTNITPLRPRQHTAPLPTTGAGQHWSGATLLEAFEQHQFTAFYQPKFDLESNRPTGVEILARWRHPHHGVLPPARFIDAVERAGLLERLGESMLQQACRSAARRQRAGLQFDLALNLPSSALTSTDVADRLLAVATDAGVAPAHVTLDVSVAGVAADIPQAVASMTHWRMHGFKVALDDMALHSLSLSQLCAMPVNELKLSRAVVASERTPGTPWDLVELLMIGKTLGLRTMAKGIERNQQYNLLRALPCNSGLGYFMARPMDDVALQAWLAGLVAAGHLTDTSDTAAAAQRGGA